MSQIIVFKNKHKLQVEDSIGEKLKNTMFNDEIKVFRLAEGVYSLSGVDMIIPKQEAFDAFPQEWERLKSMEDILPRNNFLGLESPKLKTS